MVSVETLLERRGDIPEEQAQGLIDAATAWLSRGTGYFFGEPELFEQHLLGLGADILILDDPPQIDPDYESQGVRVRVFDAPYRGGDEEEIDDFVVRGRNVYRVRGRWVRWHEYRFVYTRGYALDEGPADVREAVMQMAVLMWQELQGNDEGVIGLESESLGDYSWASRANGTDFAGRLPIVATVMRAFRKPAIAGSPR